MRFAKEAKAFQGRRASEARSGGASENPGLCGFEGAEKEADERNKRSREAVLAEPTGRKHAAANGSKLCLVSGDNSLRDPPVPIPNTEVKPQHADSTWLETAR